MNIDILDGMLIPMIGAVPVLLEVEGRYIIPIFTSKEKYDEASKSFNFQFAKCGLIKEPQDFVNSVLECRKKTLVFAVVDPYLTEQGNTRYNVLYLTDDDKKLYESVNTL